MHVCATEVIEVKDEKAHVLYPPVLIQMKEAQMLMRDCLI